MNNDKMLESANAIRESGRINMNHWVIRYRQCVSKNTKVNSGDIVRIEESLVSIEDRNQILSEECNTVGCIAGFITAKFGRVNPVVTIGEAAQTILDITEEQANNLFILQQWPREYKIKYMHSKTMGEQADVCADRIIHMVETGE
jgi:hypothetical protein